MNFAYQNLSTYFLDVLRTTIVHAICNIILVILLKYL